MGKKIIVYGCHCGARRATSTGHSHRVPKLLPVAERGPRAWHGGIRAAYWAVEQDEDRAALARSPLGLWGVCKRKARSIARRAGKRRAFLDTL